MRITALRYMRHVAETLLNRVRKSKRSLFFPMSHEDRRFSPVSREPFKQFPLVGMG